jgi:radical SAM protein with 4Fe4S-binding SPASM domain
VVVLWDGRVVPCCRDDDARVVLGDLRESSLEEIWNGPAARQLRQQLIDNAVPDGHLCSGCPWQPQAFAKNIARRHPDGARVHPLQW